MVTIDHLEKKYEGYELNISMEIPDGSIIGLVGKNGAGKSTTIKSILGLVKPDAGTVTVMGKPVEQLGKLEKEQMGVALSDSGFSQYLNVDDVAHILAKMYPTFHREQFLDRCRAYQLPLKKDMKDFSTGMKAKLRVLAAISHDSKLLVLDEPTAGLDVEARNEILDLLREYMAQDDTRSILITSHISTDLENLCDEIYLIHDGKVIIHEETDAIMDNYCILKVSKKQYHDLDQQYLLKVKEASYGYTCFTNQKQYYLENYPDIVVEKAGIDDLILMMTGSNAGR